MRSGLSAIAALAATAAVAVPALAADGDLDTTFGDAGTQTVEVGDYEYGGAAHDAVIDGQGRTVLVGKANNGDGPEWGLTRLDARGELDESFGQGGKRTDWIGLGGTLHAADLDADGMLVVAGDGSGQGQRANEFAVGRYDENGQLDDDFGQDSGTQRRSVGDVPGGIGTARDVLVLSDGDILLGGYGTWTNDRGSSDHHAVVVRLNPDGTPDSEFGVQGLVHWQASGYDNRVTSLAELPGGRIVIGGSAEHESGEEDLMFAAFTRSGADDTTFSGDGRLLVPVGDEGREATVDGLAIDDAGWIVASGTIDSFTTGRPEVVLTRLTPQGTVDGTFGTDGIVRRQHHGWTRGGTPALRRDGRILVPAEAAELGFVLLAFEADGDDDATFGDDGLVATSAFEGANAVALNGDGTRAVAAGEADGLYAAARYVLEGGVVEEEPRKDEERKQEEQKKDQPAAQTPAATPQAQPQQVPAATRAARAPRRCTSRRLFTINLRRLGIVRGDAVFRGRKVSQQRLRGTGRTIRVDLRRLAPGRYTVDVVGLSKTGRKVRVTKRYRTCGPRR